jgi:hypothetical protein
MKSSAEVEREVEATRSDLDRTVEALKEKMTPGQLFDEASRAMGSTGQQILSKFAEQAKENPLPLAVMGVGLAWLMTSSNKRQHEPYGTSSLYERRSFAPGGSSLDSGGSSLGDKMRDARDHAGDAVAGAKDRMHDAMSSVGHAGHSAAHSVSSAAHTAADKTVEYGRRAQEGFWTMLEREPLLIGGLAVVVGAAIGAALPSTEAEDRIVGEKRDELMERGKEVVQEGMQKAGQVAQAALETAKSEAKGMTGGTSQSDGSSFSQPPQGAA